MVKITIHNYILATMVAGTMVGEKEMLKEKQVSPHGGHAAIIQVAVELLWTSYNTYNGPIKTLQVTGSIYMYRVRLVTKPPSLFLLQLTPASLSRQSDSSATGWTRGLHHLILQ